MSTTSYPVIGLTCDHCARAVTEELSALDGVRTVEVDVVPDGVSTVTVTGERDLTVTELTTALDEAGNYTLAR